MNGIREILNRSSTMPVSATSGAAISLALANGELTPELARILSETYGLELTDTDIFGFEEAREHPAWDRIRAQFPGSVLFGWNRSSEVFFIDAEDSLHEGAGAVFAVDKSYIEPATVRLLAPELLTFLRNASSDLPDWSQPFQMDVLIERLRMAIQSHPDRIDARPGLGRHEIADRTAARGMVLAGTYSAFLEIANGMRFVRSGLEIFGLDELTPIGEENPARLFLCGRDRQREITLAITGNGLARPSDLLLQMGASENLISAPSYGRVLNTLIAWIESEAEVRP